jgi:hypothetical protein
VFNFSRVLVLVVVVVLGLAMSTYVTRARHINGVPARFANAVPIGANTLPSQYKRTLPSGISTALDERAPRSAQRQSQVMPQSTAVQAIMHTATSYFESALTDDLLVQMAENGDLAATIASMHRNRTSNRLPLDQKRKFVIALMAGGLPNVLQLAALPLPGDKDLHEKAVYAIAAGLHDPAVAPTSTSMLRQIVAFAEIGGEVINVDKARDDAKELVSTIYLSR